MKQGLPERLWSKVDFDRLEGCWLWTGCTDGKYGQIWVEGKMRSAPRVAWELVHGPWPEGMHSLHSSSCTSTLCVRPAHIRPGTHKENMYDRALSGGYISFTKVSGKDFRHKNGRFISKLTSIQWLEIKILRLSGATIKSIALRYDVTTETLRKTLKGCRRAPQS